MVDDIGALLVIALFYSDDIRIVPLLVAVGTDRRDRAGAVTCPPAAGPPTRCSAFALWVALYIGGVHPTLAGVAVALLIPVFTPERRQVEEAVELIRAFRQSPNSEYARAATRGLRESISINERLQTEFGPYVSFLVLPLFALANAGRAADRETHVGGDAVTADVGHRRRPGDRQVHRHHRCDMAGARYRLGQLAPGPDAAPGRRRRRAVRNRLHHLAFHRRHRDHRSAPAGPGPRRRAARVRASRSSLGWAIFRITDWLSPPEAVGLKLIRPVDPDRDHIRGKPDAPLTLVEYGDFECPFCSRATGSIDEVRAHFGDELRYVWRHLPLERVHPRAFDAARASEAAALQGKFFEMAHELFAHPGRSGVVGHLPLRRRDRAATSNGSTRTCACIRRRCCTGCRTTRRTPS